MTGERVCSSGQSELRKLLSLTLSRGAAPRGPKSLPVTEVEPLGVGKQHKMWLIKPHESIKLVANTIAPNATAAR